MKFWCVKIALFAPISYSCQFSRLTAKIDALKLQLLWTDKLDWLSAMCPTLFRPSVHPYVTKGQLLKWIIWVWMTFFFKNTFQAAFKCIETCLKNGRHTFLKLDTKLKVRHVRMFGHLAKSLSSWNHVWMGNHLFFYGCLFDPMWT